MARLLLKLFLRIHAFIYEQVMYRLAPKAFGGSHPKNIFHYRSEFFLENVDSNDFVLDLACGQGRILKNVATKIKKGVGVEQNPKMLALARQNCPDNLDFHEGDIFSGTVQEILKSGVSKIVLSHILEHLPDPVAFLKTLQGKELLICVPSEENWYRQLLKDLGLNHLSDPTHFREYTRSLLRAHLAAAGYRADLIAFNSEGEIICRAISAR